MFRVRSGEERAFAAFALPRFLVVLMGSFAVMALVLTVIGLYGLLSYAVARRRREIGLRIALGAGRREVLGLVLRQAMRLVTAGLVLGLVAAAGAGKLLAGIAAGVQTVDALFLAVAAAVMALTSLAAAYFPARRAASVEPMQALRTE